MDRFYFLAPALVLLATLAVAFVIYCWLCATGRTPNVDKLKHNELLGPFMARYLVWLISPIERLMIGRVSPNAVTTLSLLACIATGVAAGMGHLATATWLFVLGGVLDVLDGRLARLTNQQTASGALFDSVSDRWAELFAFTGYAWYLRDSVWLLAVMAAIGASMMVSYTRARAEGLGLELSGGMMQRAERIILVSAGTLLAAWYGASPAHATLVVPILGWTMAICAVTSMATALNRWVVAFRELARRDVEHAIVQPAPIPAKVRDDNFAPVPAKLRESAELTPAAHRL